MDSCSIPGIIKRNGRVSPPRSVIGKNEAPNIPLRILQPKFLRAHDLPLSLFSPHHCRLRSTLPVVSRISIVTADFASAGNVASSAASDISMTIGGHTLVVQHVELTVDRAELERAAPPRR
jgi:hypothetical protein